MGEYNLTNAICNQFEETHSPQRNNVATTINFFKKKSPQEILQNLKTLWKQHRASDGDRNFTEINPNRICIPSPT